MLSAIIIVSLKFPCSLKVPRRGQVKRRAAGQRNFEASKENVLCSTGGALAGKLAQTKVSDNVSTADPIPSSRGENCSPPRVDIQARANPLPPSDAWDCYHFTSPELSDSAQRCLSIKSHPSKKKAMSSKKTAKSSKKTAKSSIRLCPSSVEPPARLLQGCTSEGTSLWEAFSVEGVSKATNQKKITEALPVAPDRPPSTTRTKQVKWHSPVVLDLPPPSDAEGAGETSCLLSLPPPLHSVALAAGSGLSGVEGRSGRRNRRRTCREKPLSPSSRLIPSPLSVPTQSNGSKAIRKRKNSKSIHVVCDPTSVELHKTNCNANLDTLSDVPSPNSQASVSCISDKLAGVACGEECNGERESGTAAIVPSSSPATYDGDPTSQPRRLVCGAECEKINKEDINAIQIHVDSVPGESAYAAHVGADLLSRKPSRLCCSMSREEMLVAPRAIEPTVDSAPAAIATVADKDSPSIVSRNPTKQARGRTTKQARGQTTRKRLSRQENETDCSTLDGRHDCEQPRSSKSSLTLSSGASSYVGDDEKSRASLHVDKSPPRGITTPMEIPLPASGISKKRLRLDIVSPAVGGVAEDTAPFRMTRSQAAKMRLEAEKERASASLLPPRKRSRAPLCQSSLPTEKQADLPTMACGTNETLNVVSVKMGRECRAPAAVAPTSSPPPAIATLPDQSLEIAPPSPPTQESITAIRVGTYLHLVYAHTLVSITCACARFVPLLCLHTCAYWVI